MLTMQISLLIPILLQAVASTLAADISTTGSHNSYSCTAVSDELSEYCCVQFQLYPGDLDHCPDVQVYNYAGESSNDQTECEERKLTPYANPNR